LRPGNTNSTIGEAIMSVNESIEGKNLIKFGDFSGEWREFWDVEEPVLELKDSDTGKPYLSMTEGATVTQTFPLEVCPGEDAVYWFSFAYEVVGSKPSHVTLTTGGGRVVFEEPFYSRKSQEDAGTLDNEVLVDLSLYPPTAIQGLSSSDTEIVLVVTSANNGFSGGINVTDIKIDPRIVPLSPSEIWFDGRSISLAV